MRADQAKTIPIDRYLENQGFRPVKTRQGGRELWYQSPIRDGDSDPSFKVDVILNAWFDHGLGKGGNTLDLAIELHRSSVSEALAHLERTRLYSPHTHRTLPANIRSANFSSTKRKTPAGEKENNPSFELLEQKPLQHPALLQYLDKRGINPNVARKYLSQIDFKRPQSRSRYFALGYPAGNGYEARNALFKGFVGSKKDITLHSKADSPLLLVFEGFMDFLTYLTIKELQEAEGSVIVLNSGNMRARALPYIKDDRYSEIRLYLDNDDMGDETVRYFLAHGNSEHIADMRSHYASYSDLNAWHLEHRT